MQIKGLFREGIKHALRLWHSPQYRDYCRLVGKYGRTPRHTPFQIVSQGICWNVPDVASFLSAWREIFLEEIYRFHPANSRPVVLDFGANIGVSVFYFKKNFPDAEIYAYEADPGIYAYLKKNLEKNGISGVTLRNQAVWSCDDTVHFVPDGADGGHIGSGESMGNIPVEAVDVRKIVRTFPHIDFLKIDIEGAECEVLPALFDDLDRVENLFVEYHGTTESRLGVLLSVLEDAGFQIWIHSEECPARPFYDPPLLSDFQLQLNIFARKKR